jgi:nickel superoxide dismutase
MKRILTILLVTVTCAGGALAHCEIPCGIYDDEARLAEIAEHVTTIEKSMTMIGELSSGPDIDHNQLARWVANKEEHAEAIQHVVWQYFMTQRVKPVDPGGDGHRAYVKKLTLLHGMLVQAMKAKQSVDPEVVARLRELLTAFSAAYAGH